MLQSEHALVRFDAWPGWRNDIWIGTQVRVIHNLQYNSIRAPQAYTLSPGLVPLYPLYKANALAPAQDSWLSTLDVIPHQL